MNSSQAATPGWIAPVAALICNAGWRGSFLVALPEYRSLIVRKLAEALDLDFVDFRAEQLTALGWQAGQLELLAQDRFIGDSLSRSGRGIVLHNSEALLATKLLKERRDWLAALVATDWCPPVLMPVSVFHADIPPPTERAHSVEPAALPANSFLMRPASR